jgi:dTDP-4-dehydrorhamnose 3,5-epimerase
MTTEYAPAHESGLMWNDPALAISWPISSPVLSERDQKWPPFSTFRHGVGTQQQG